MASLEELKKDFGKIINADKLAHGYILFGHESAELKLEFASHLANFLENGDWALGERALSDASILDARKDGGIDIVREATHFLWQKPSVSKKRCLIINNADRLTLPAQNAILKIAEEPPASALLLLLLKDPEALLPAVVSRFQKIFVARDREAGSPDTAMAKDFLNSGAAKRKDILKKLMEDIKEEEDDNKLEIFVTGLFSELRKDTRKNYKTLKELASRWALIRQFNLNKKLQLEAALANI